jgi:hypothetical protein
VIVFFISHNIFTVQVSSIGIGVLHQGLNILGGSKLVAECGSMAEKGVLLNILVEGLLEKKSVEWTLIILFLLMDVKLSQLFHWQQPKLQEKSKQWELSTEWFVQEFRKRLTSYIRSCLNGGIDMKAVSFRGDSNKKGVSSLNCHRV